PGPSAVWRNGYRASAARWDPARSPGSDRPRRRSESRAPPPAAAPSVRKAIALSFMLPLHDSHEQIVMNLLHLRPQRIERGPVADVHFILKRLDALEQRARLDFRFLEIFRTLARIFARLFERLLGDLDRLAHFADQRDRLARIAVVINATRRFE